MSVSTIAAASLSVKPLSGALGADVEGVDLTRLADATFAHIARAWADYLVLRFRGQHLGDIDLMAFSRRFGALDRVPVRANDVMDIGDPRIAIDASAREYVTIISNVKIGGMAIGGLGNYESSWHTDMSYNETPPSASLLYGIEVPPSGGDTSFCNMYLAYDTLDAATRERIANLTCIHDASRNSSGELRRGFADHDDPAKTVGARHPLVRRHPVTKRACLFLGRRRNACIPELPLGESERLLDQLWKHATQDRFTWTQQWQQHDLVIWDNRCAMHRRDGFDDRYARVMHRTQVVGTKPERFG
jgi:taurine dioxygenase